MPPLKNHPVSRDQKDREGGVDYLQDWTAKQREVPMSRQAKILAMISAAVKLSKKASILRRFRTKFGKGTNWRRRKPF